MELHFSEIDELSRWLVVAVGGQGGPEGQGGQGPRWRGFLAGAPHRRLPSELTPVVVDPDVAPHWSLAREGARSGR